MSSPPDASAPTPVREPRPADGADLPLAKVRRWLREAVWSGGVLSRHGRPRHLLFFGVALGDDLLCTAALRELRRRGHRGLWMMSRHPSLFELNDDVDAVVPWERRYHMLAWRLGARITRAWYARYDEVRDVSTIPDRHIIALMCQAAGLSGPVTLRPYLTLSDAERERGRLAERQVVVQSSGLSAHWAMPNKEWEAARFQQVVRALRRDFTFVQLGSPSDPPLDGCIDLRGRTTMNGYR
jgi:hypothetical protein